MQPQAHTVCNFLPSNGFLLGCADTHPATANIQHTGCSICMNFSGVCFIEQLQTSTIYLNPNKEMCDSNECSTLTEIHFFPDCTGFDHLSIPFVDAITAAGLVIKSSAACFCSFPANNLVKYEHQTCLHEFSIISRELSKKASPFYASLTRAT